MEATSASQQLPALCLFSSVSGTSGRGEGCPWGTSSLPSPASPCAGSAWWSQVSWEAFCAQHPQMQREREESPACLRELSCARETHQRHRLATRTRCFLTSDPCSSSLWNKTLLPTMPYCLQNCHVANNLKIQTFQVTNSSAVAGCASAQQSSERSTPASASHHTPTYGPAESPQPAAAAQGSLRRGCCPGKPRRLCSLTPVGLGSGLYSFRYPCHTCKQVALGGVI